MMIHKVAIGLLLAPTLSLAQPGSQAFAMPSDAHQQEQTADQRQLANCANLATIYRLSAQYRDAGFSPQQSYQNLIHWTRNGISDRELRDVINAVYFNPRFENAGGQALHNQMLNLCMSATGPQREPIRPLD